MQNSIQIFSDWCFERDFLKSSNFFIHSINNNPILFKIKIDEWSKQYYQVFFENPFDKSIQEITIDYLSNLNSNLHGITMIFGYQSSFTGNIEVSKFILQNYIPYLVLIVFGEDCNLYHLDKENFILNSKIPHQEIFYSSLLENEKIPLAAATSHLTYLYAYNNNVMLDLVSLNIFFKLIDYFINDRLDNKLDLYLDNCINGLQKNTILKNRNRYIAALQLYKDFLKTNLILKQAK